MARIRSIKPEFFSDGDIGGLPPLVRLLFVGMWCEADKAGRLKDKPKSIKARCLPFDNLDIGKALKTLESGRFIIRYTVDGEAYIQIRTWSEHQRPHHTEKESNIPGTALEKFGEVFEKHPPPRRRTSETATDATISPVIDGSLTVKQPLDNGKKERCTPPPPFPSLIKGVLGGDEQFATAWASWVIHRKQIKKPLTGEQTKKQLAAFEQWGAARSIAAIEHTIRQGWQGLREPEGPNGKPAIDQGAADMAIVFQRMDERKKQKVEADGQQ